MSTEQGDVDVIRAYLEGHRQIVDGPDGEFVSRIAPSAQPPLAALDRLAAALGEAEREVREWRDDAELKQTVRADKAERALAQMREALERLADETDSLGGVTCGCVQFARAALRPEDTSDES